MHKRSHGREGKGREGKGREGKGREGKGREGKEGEKEKKVRILYSFFDFCVSRHLCKVNLKAFNSSWGQRGGKRSGKSEHHGCGAKTCPDVNVIHIVRVFHLAPLLDLM